MATTRYLGLIGLIGLTVVGFGTALIAQEPAPNFTPPPQQPPAGNPFGADPRGVPAQPQNPFGHPGAPGFAPGQPAPEGPPPFGMDPFPELGKKTNGIMALRVIVESGLTAKEIQAILPALRDLRDAEKNFKKRAEQLLDEEKNALLAAPPGGPMPPNSGQRMQEAGQTYHERTHQAWATIDRELLADVRQDGMNKAQMLRQLVMGGPPQGFQGGFGGNGFGGGFGGQGFGGQGFGPPNGVQPGQPGQGFFTPQPGQYPPNGQGGRGRGGREGGGKQGPPRAGTPQGVPENSFFLDQAPATPETAPPGDALENIEQGVPPAIEGVPQAPGAPVPGQRPPGNFGQRGRGGQGGAGFGGPPANGGPGQFFAPQPFMNGGPRISLSELVELLEQRLAAMPK